MRIPVKVFKSGNSLALRLPKSLNMKIKNYALEPANGSFRVIDTAMEAKRLKALQALRGSCPDFPNHD